MRELARREPTFALHVHVAVPDPDAAVRALDGVREELPLLLALSANSPYWQGRDSGLASARIPVFQAFPRTGTPRSFGTYEAYVEAVDVLIRCDAIPEPTFLWWDARLQPRLGTLEVRIMDAQTRVRDSAALAALVQCLVRREALERTPEREPVAPEVLEENRFLAARDGMDANFVDPLAGRCVPVADKLAETLRSCAPHAERLRCRHELAAVRALAERPGAMRQRTLAGRPEGLPGVLRAMHGDFVSGLPEPAVAG
jgi:carboxylate-amine ligase